MPLDRRDLYENLLILCNKCHKIVDDQVNHYAVTVLRKLKEEHETWVRETLDQGDPVKKRDDLVYAGYVDAWAKQSELDNWVDWSYGMLSLMAGRVLVRNVPREWSNSRIGFWAGSGRVDTPNLKQHSITSGAYWKRYSDATWVKCELE